MRRAQPRAEVEDQVQQLFQSSPDACAGRNHVIAAHPREDHTFQSSPDACAGRNEAKPTGLGSGVAFQSSPDACAGRNRDCVARRGIYGDVSILARRMRRAQLQ